MANYVYSRIEFERISESGKEVLKNLFSRLSRDSNGTMWFEDIFNDGSNESFEEDKNTHDFMYNNVGAKWCYVDDLDETSISTTSAWAWPENGFEWIFEQVGKVDPDFIGTVTYEDEMPNFIGAAVYTADGPYDYVEESYDDLVELLKQEHQELNEHWDEDEECFDSEGDEIIFENIYDLISEIQSQFIYDTVQGIKEYE